MEVFSNPPSMNLSAARKLTALGTASPSRTIESVQPHIW